MSQKLDPPPQPPAGPPPPSYTPSEANVSMPAPHMEAQNTGQSSFPNGGPNNFAPGGYQPPQGPFQPQQGFMPQQGYPPPAAGYYGPYQGNPPNGNFGQPPYGAYNAGGPPQGEYVDSRGKSKPGFAEGLLAACACCCCLDLLF
ncbi:hypothetical protein OnM2_023076 [Erysiphe neolycopersici]|uniref:Cysteine-rich transmembrane CYSTM domain-containing protein n=1 Tax=Erysiphe neolycopersici TaxID=212602 RepID=A0A420I280_9PEZI|nr:hypothetical protein OnM2_023076 [Erysiphe neolycopersici]